ncbi:T9SS type A sorting domain-containing protein [Flaviramulus aquimarinus]|uniref:T9SS type A sorting domain-containing protein n=1 Tax=Flaviramulus aquimarinus TaxID=1170456 RepID=A0ABP9EQV3_9FLAO
MKINLHIIFLFCFVLSVQAQDTTIKLRSSESYSIMRSNLGIGGSSNTVTTKNGAYSVSHSIGQSSVIGTHYNNGYYLRQGYQQPLNKIKVVEEFSNNDLLAKIHPNPFEQFVSISFNEAMENDISVLVFDVSGKLVYSRKFQPSQKIKLNLESIPNGNYILKALSNSKSFNAKLIKM